MSQTRNFEGLFRGFQAIAPELSGEFCKREGPVLLSLSFSVQPGLRFSVELQFQGDELCIGVGDSLWLEYFPAHEENVVQDFQKDVEDLLLGRARVIESWRRGRPVRAELQAIRDGVWKVIGTWSRLHLPFGSMEKRELSRRPSALGSQKN
jgi:hypothetical protein